jgi:hypothetical protein
MPAPKKKALPLLAVAISMPLLAACQPQGPVVVDAPNDNCAVHRAIFRQTESSFNEVAQGVALSAAGGVAAGVLVGVLTGNTRAGLATGIGVAAVGITATLVNANFRQLDQEARRQALLQQTVAVDKYGERVTGATQSLERLSDCRRGQVAAIRADLRSGATPRPLAQARLDEVRSWYEGDTMLVGAFDQRLANDTRQLEESTRYVDATVYEQERSFRPYSAILARGGPAYVAPDAGSGQAGQLSVGQTVQVTAQSGGWLQISMGRGRSGYVRSTYLARSTGSRAYVGGSEQSLRAEATDSAAEVGRVANGSPYRVVGTMPGWLVVDQGPSKSFVRATALRPAQVDNSGREVVSSAATAVAARDAFSQGATGLASEARRLSLDG